LVNGSSIYVCETKPIVVEGLLRVAAGCDQFYICGHSPEVADAMPDIETLRPDLVLIGGHAHSRTLPNIIPRLLAVAPSSRIVLWPDGELAAHETVRCLQMGASGVLRQSAPVAQMLDCLNRVAKGEVWLERSLDSFDGDAGERSRAPRITRRERDIIEHLCRGLKNKEIAQALAITPGTVKTHLMHVFEKTGMKDRFQLALHGRQLLDSLEVSRERAS
jgi:two-component system, NarL family, nitrate/nitrite response regulator NarL